jgi:hypothetical protein
VRECLVDRDIDEPIETIRDKTVRSKKAMKCGECGRDIPSGTPFRIEVGRLDGDYTHNITCLTCLELRNRFCCSWWYGGILEDIVYELEENGGALELGCLDGLSPDAFGFIADTLDQIWSEDDNAAEIDRLQRAEKGE